MKNLYLIFSIILVLLAATGPVKAKIPPTSRAAELNYVKQIIDREIDYPKNCDQGTCGIVKVLITIQPDQTVHVDQINGQPELTSYVEAQLQKVIVAYPRLIGRRFICKFDFRSS